jgi:transposase
MGGNNDVERISAGGSAKRRYRTKQERRRIAEESLQPGTSVAVLARRHGVNANQVFHWRKLLREGRLEIQPATAQLLPVRIAEDKPGPIAPQPGTIHLEFRQVRVRVEGAVDRATLRVILEHLGR